MHVLLMKPINNTYPTVVMEMKLHQIPSHVPLGYDGWKCPGLKRLSWSTNSVNAQCQNHVRTLFNCSSRPHGLRVNSPFGLRPLWTTGSYSPYELEEWLLNVRPCLRNWMTEEWLASGKISASKTLPRSELFFKLFSVKFDSAFHPYEVSTEWLPASAGG